MLKFFKQLFYRLLDPRILFISRITVGLIEQCKFLNHRLLLVDLVLQRGQPLQFPFELRCVGYIFSLEVIDVIGTDRWRALPILSGGRLLFVHFLAERVAVFDLGGNGSELLREVDFEKVEHRVKGDRKFIFCVFFDLLNEDVVAGQVRDEAVEVDIAGESDQELNLLLVHYQ